jgi:hypothetical protein
VLRLVGGQARHKPIWLTKRYEEDGKIVKTIQNRGGHIAFFVKSDDIEQQGQED